ncbi:DNA polymerase III subunit beta [Candidatus Fermentibacteria bacterium]|nr:MAG: DNA polymerase III subunit beta [Candidatus Fermentibacteria bacterium]PIE52326.1 MAG: DNA polymerase III subunit beta [Candidatus Fermentibacteria bacterium]
MVNLLVDHKTLLQGLNTVSSALPPKTSLPSLSNILLETDSEKLKLAATDLDTTVITWIPATISSQGAVALPGKKLLEIVRELQGKDVSISTSGSRTAISCEKSSFTLPGSSRDSYPSLPSPGSAEDRITLPFESLKEGISRTSYAVAGASEIRTSLTGSLWKFTSENLEMVATDGHRLARIRFEQLKSDSEREAIIAPKALSLLQKLSNTDEVSMSFQGSQVSFHVDETSIYSRVIDGPYPPYDKVIPSGNNRDLTVNREDLLSALKRMGIIANPATHQILFTIERNKVILHAENTDAGEAREDIEAVYSSDPLQIAFNGSLVVDILRNMKSEDVRLSMLDGSTAVIITEDSQNDEIVDYLTLVMPVRLPDTV